jgi:hypothetical protein
MKMITKAAIDGRKRDFLTELEVRRLLDAARRSRHGVRVT